ncbi:M4 family metallopeptidase [Bdellovibrio svalbardensis]|uniref:Neutral metalloproteinase n=1 Tax=Bdellovibrio svalbardensis TaxID=2972972 RepID=A0ABT6DME1_9BACT|nr:M4 family metallopeptidase [Bdellovibrio svalbardensis]MDG0816303.1 M4 family metallopeptidase [Bdellovibrio svalbardensis]
MKFSRLLAAGLIFVSISAKAGDVIIYDAGLNPLAGIGDNKGVRVLTNGQRVGAIWKRLFISDEAKRANENITLTRDFYKNTFGRDSFDGRGSNVEAVVRLGGNLIDLFGLKQNAAWDGKKFLFGGGESDGLKKFTGAVDVIAHEYTHAVVQFSSKLKYEGQSGALNEHLADFFGQMVQVRTGRGADDFLIGETIISDDLKAAASNKRGYPVVALRDMLHPERGLSSQPAHMSQIPADLGQDCRPTMKNDNCGVHALSGIPNRATALIVQQLGWAKASPIFYVVMTERLTENSQFQDYAREVIGECLHQLSPMECSVINNSFKEVGL